MKKLFLALLLSLILLTACSSNPMGDYKIDRNNHFIVLSFDETMTLLENKTPGTYYIGYPGCKWCQALVPYLEARLADHDTTAHYLNVSAQDYDSERFSEWYETLPSGLQSSEERGSVPFTISISSSGNFVAHTGTTPAHTDPTRELSDNEKIFLNARLDAIILNGLD